MTREIKIRVVVDSRGAIKGIRTVGGEIVDLTKLTRAEGSKFGRIMEQAYGFSLATQLQRVLPLLREGVETAFELGTAAEETASKFQTTFDDAAAQVDDFLRSFANLAGLTQTEGREAAATIGAIGQGFGLTSQESATFSQNVLKLAGDLASFNNASIEDTLAAIRSGLVGEQEPLKRFGILISQADAQMRALELTGKKNVKQLSQQDLVLARLQLAYDRAGVQVGDLERTQDSTANTARRLSARLREQGEVLSQGLLPTFKLVLDVLDDMQQQSGNALRAFVRFVSLGVFDAVAALVRLQAVMADAAETLGIVSRASDLSLEQFALAIPFIENMIQSYQLLETTLTGIEIGTKKVRQAITGLTGSIKEVLGDEDAAEEAARRQSRIQKEIDLVRGAFFARLQDRADLDKDLAKRRKKLQEFLDSLSQLGAQANTAINNLTSPPPPPPDDDGRLKHERALQQLRIDLMKEGIDRELAEIDLEFERRKDLIREKFPELADELIAAADAARQRARDRVFGIDNDAALQDLEALNDTLIEEVAASERAAMEEAAGVFEEFKRRRVEANQAMTAADRERVNQFVAGSAQELLTAQNATASVLALIKREITALLAKTIAKALASLGPAALFVGPVVAFGIRALFDRFASFASGGLVTGPGGPRDDAILARVSNGEFVVNAEATQRHLSTLQAINAGAEALPLLGLLGTATARPAARADRDTERLLDALSRIERRITDQRLVADGFELKALLEDVDRFHKDNGMA